MKTVQPDGWPRPSGYSNGIVTKDGLLFVAGQVGWDEKEKVVSDDLVEQIRQALRNVVSVLEAGGAAPSNVVRMTWFVTDIAAYRANLSEIGAVYREIMGNHYPAMSLLGVSGLVEDGAKVEIEATASLE